MIFPIWTIYTFSIKSCYSYLNIFSILPPIIFLYVYSILMLTNFPFRLLQQRTDETRIPPTYKSGTPSHPIFCVNPTSFTPASFINVLS